MEHVKKLLIISLVLIIFLSTAHSEVLTMERLHFEKELDDIKTVKIINPIGDIRIRQTTDQNFIFHAVSQYSKHFKATLKTERVEKTLNLTINIPDRNLMTGKERVDAAIIIPENIQLIIDIEQGNLSSKKLNNKLIISSNTSDIDVKTSQSAEIISKHGSISFTLISDKFSDNIKLQSYDKNVSVYFHSNNIPSIEVLTGSVTTTNSMKILQSKTISGRKVLYNQKSPKDKISIQTDTGFIQIVELEKIKKR